MRTRRNLLVAFGLAVLVAVLALVAARSLRAPQPREAAPPAVAALPAPCPGQASEEQLASVRTAARTAAQTADRALAEAEKAGLAAASAGRWAGRASEATAAGHKQLQTALGLPKGDTRRHAALSESLRLIVDETESALASARNAREQYVGALNAARAQQIQLDGEVSEAMRAAGDVERALAGCAGASAPAPFEDAVGDLFRRAQKVSVAIARAREQAVVLDAILAAEAASTAAAKDPRTLGAMAEVAR